MRFNHMELTFPTGNLTTALREEIDAFYGSIFGWKGFDTDVVGQSCHLLMPDPDQFILLAESERPMSSPGYDHLGLLQDTRQEVDDLLDACERYAEKDDRVSIKHYEDLVYPGLTVHAFYVKYLLADLLRRAEHGALVGPMRFDHMELTIPVGSLTTTLRKEIDDFYGSIFGWSGFDMDVAGRPCRLLMCGSDQFIQLLESDRPMHSPGSDHLGLLLESRQDVDDALEACERYAET